MVTPGSAGAAGSTGALFVVRRGGGDAGPALEWVVPGNRLSLPEERMAVPQSGSGDSSIFSKASCRYSKRAGLVHTGMAPRILLNWLPREGSGKGSVMEVLYTSRGLGTKERAGTLACMTFGAVYLQCLPETSGPFLVKESSGP